jgi:replication factor A1
MYKRELKTVKISELKPGMDNVSVKVRVLDVQAPKVIETRKGPRTISEATVGDDTGRVRLTLWGRAAGSVNPGDAVEIHGAWTTSYRGNVVLNVGGRGEIIKVDDKEVPDANEIPEKMPRAPRQQRRRRQRF